MELLKKQIQNSLQLRPELVEKVATEEELLDLIETLIEELVNNDFEKLLLLLYRLDVSEKKVKKAIDLSGPTKASRSIAELVLAREKEKAISREKYKTDSSDWEF
ncbi:MAG: hypothetical protein ACI9O4_000153 [Chitinophagales bacterium]